MKYIRKSDVEEVLQKFIDVRKDKNCSKQQIVERRAFEYALAVVRQVKEYDFQD